jgi:hypothetical protein
MDQQRLAGPQAAALEGIVPDGEEGLGDCGGFDRREPRGSGRAWLSCAEQYSA